MKMMEKGCGPGTHWSLYPTTAAERLLLDRLWEALQSRNFPEWCNVSVVMSEPGGSCSTTERVLVAGRGVYSSPRTSREDY
jgi:hypothetical protein